MATNSRAAAILEEQDVIEPTMVLTVISGRFANSAMLRVFLLVGQYRAW